MYYFLLGLQGVTSIIVFAEFLYIFHRGSSRYHIILMLLTLAAWINNAGYFLEILSTSRDAALVGVKISYLGKTFIPFLILLFALNYCGVKISTWINMALAVFHAGIWALVLSCDHHSLFYTYVTYLRDAPFPHLESGHGPFYFIFMLFAGAYFFVAAFFLIREYRKEDNEDRKRQIIGILLVLVISVIGLALVVSGCTGGYDTTAVAYAVGSWMLILGIRRYDFLDTVEEAKRYAMNTLNEGLIILNQYYQPLYYNRMVEMVLPEITKAVLDEEYLFQKNKVYKIEKQDIQPKKGRQIYLYLLKDITDSYYYEEQLEREVALQTKKAEERREKVEKMSLQIVRTLADTIDAKDEYTKEHSSHVAVYATALARELGYSEEALSNLRHAALLHDIGKISIPDSILNKPGKLTDIEYEVIKSHTTVGGDILNHMDVMPGVLEGARYHHERYDGKGYPDHLSGTDIPEIARIICLADAYDAMNSRRVYRDRLPREKIREQLVSGRGTQFDPAMTDVFVRLLDEGKLEIKEIEDRQAEIDGTGLVLQRVMSTMAQKDTRERDILTGLMLRYEGETAISEALRKQEGCLCFIDVDNLKKINDTLGHLAGDHLLKEVGGVLKRYEEQAIVCRLGGDEFLMYLPGADREKAEEVMKGLIRSFEKKKEGDASMKAASISAGIYICEKGENYAQALTNADKALYHIKQNGKAGYSFYQKKIEQTGQTSDIDMARLIQSLQNSGNYQGALDVEYRMFTRLYEYVRNLEKRFEYKFHLALITLETREEITVDEQERAMDCMEQAIRSAIRNTDICSRYSGVQFLVIFAYIGEENIKPVMGRILKKYSKLCQGKQLKVSYQVANMEIPEETRAEARKENQTRGAGKE